MTTCEICGRGPAIAIHARKYTGLLLFGDTTFWKGDACRQCGVSLYRTGAAHCLWAGWWGPVPFVVNPLLLVRNFRGLREFRSVDDPVGEPLAEPLEPGRPVFRRPAAVLGALVPLVVVVALVLVAAVLMSRSRVDDLAVGDCIALGADRDIDVAERVDCDSAHSAEVTGRVGRDGDDTSCTAATLDYLGGTGVDGVAAAALQYSGDGGDELVCLVVANGGGRLTGSQRGSGR